MLSGGAIASGSSLFLSCHKNKGVETSPGSPVGPGVPPPQQASVLNLKLISVTDIGPASASDNNNVAWDQEKVISYGNYQYVGYWDNNNKLTIARRDINNNKVQAVDLGHTRTDNDGHRNVCLGISPADGRLHLSYDHIVSTLHYRRSVANFITKPPANISASDFMPEESMTGINENAMTYPKFIHMNDGTLLFNWYTRGNYPTQLKGGLNCLNRYNAVSGTWSYIGVIIDGDVNTGGVLPGEPEGSVCYQSASRIGYLNYFIVDAQNRIHLSWVFRENYDSSPIGNHDLYYAYSDDYGVIWKNSQNVHVADLVAKRAITVSSPGIKVYDIPCSSGMYLVNQGTMGIDSKRNPHIIMTSSIRTNITDPEANRTLIHFWRTTDGKWHKNYLKDNSIKYPWSPARGTLFIDEKDDILFYNQSGYLETYTAKAGEGWANWQKTTHNTITKILNGSGYVFDHFRIKDKKILSIPAVSAEDNRFKLIEFTL